MHPALVVTVSFLTRKKSSASYCEFTLGGVALVMAMVVSLCCGSQVEADDERGVCTSVRRSSRVVVQQDYLETYAVRVGCWHVVSMVFRGFRKVLQKCL